LPFASFIIPTFNSEKYIENTLNSVFSQKFNDFEVLIIDNCSTDKTKNIIEKYQEKEKKRCILIQNNENKGIPFARNQGWEKVNSPYILHLDHDDLALPFRLQTQIDFMENNPEITASGTDVKYFGQNDNSWLVPKNSNYIQASILFHSPIANPSAIFRTQILKDNQIKHNLDYSLASDYDIWRQLAMIGKLENLAITCTHIHKHLKNASQNDLQIKLESLQIQKKYFLDTLQIDLNEEELNIAFEVTKNIKTFDLKEYLEKVENLFQKIIQQNQKTHFFSSVYLQKVMEEIWLKNFAGNLFMHPHITTIFQKSSFSPFQKYSFYQKLKFFMKKFLYMKQLNFKD
jgi:glycosyltransferase involved in cell wall biosynthesis